MLLIPEIMKTYPNWVCWKAVPDPKSHSGIKKIPINPKTERYAKSNDPQTWSDYDTARRVASKYNGIGFMFERSPFLVLTSMTALRQSRITMTAELVTLYMSSSILLNPMLKFHSQVTEFTLSAKEICRRVAEEKAVLRCMKVADFS